MNVFDLFVTVSAKDEASAEINDISNNVLGKLGKAAMTAGKALAGMWAVKKVYDFGKAAYDSYASYEQLVGGVDKLFGKSSNKLQEYAQQSYLTAGTSANEYMEQVTSFSASLIGSLKGDTEKAAEQADVAMRSMSDNANTFGTDMASIQNAYQGFAKQNYTMLDNLKLGYGGTKEEMERLIKDANAYAKEQGKASKLTIDSFSDIVTAIELVQEKQNIAGTTQKEALSTLEGSANAFGAAWQNLITEVGKPDADIGARVRDMMTAVFGQEGKGGLARNLIKEVKVIAKNVALAMPEVAAEMFGSLRDSVRNVIRDQFGDKAAGVFDSVLDGIASLPDRFSGVVTSIEKLVNQVKETGKGMFDSVVSAVAPVLPKLQEVADAAGPVLSVAIGTGRKAVRAFGMVFESVVPLITPLVTMVSDVLVDHVFPALKKVLRLAGKAFDTFGEKVSAFVELVEPSVTRIATFVTDVFGAMSDAIGGLADFVADPVGSITKAMDDIAYSAEDSEGRVSSSMDGIEGYVTDATKKSEEAIDRYNRKPFKDKKAKVAVDGNAVDGSGRRNVNDTETAIKNLKGKDVTVNVKQKGLTAGLIDNIRGAIDKLKSKEVTVTTTKVTKKSKDSGGAWGGIRYHATGGVKIADRFGPGVPLDVVGERGPEAIVPLTSRYGGDFARMMGAEAGKYIAGHYGGGNTYQLIYNGEQAAVELFEDLTFMMTVTGAMD